MKLNCFVLPLIIVSVVIGFMSGAETQRDKSFLKDEKAQEKVVDLNKK